MKAIKEQKYFICFKNHSNKTRYVNNLKQSSESIKKAKSFDSLQDVIEYAEDNNITKYSIVNQYGKPI